ncbi:MAG: hydrogenase iron-sulfur subunit [Candidatus Firestonebacteria bacterium]
MSNNETKKLNVVGFLCNWCSYAGADMTGLGRNIYPSNIKIIRIPCTGRMDPMMIIEAFHNGADGVLVSGCHPGDCHYSEGNFYWRRRYPHLKGLLEHFGIDKRRFHASWVSASEGKKFAEVVKKVVAEVKDWRENG